MAIKRARRDTNYTIISNVGMRDDNLSLKAKGLLAYMLTLPDDWTFYEQELVKHSKDGRDSHRSALKELQDHGYLVKVQKNENGKFGEVDWEIYDEPLTDKPSTDKPSTEIPRTEKPRTENPPLLSTNSTKDLLKQNTNNTNNSLTNKETEIGELVVDSTAIHFYKQSFGRINKAIADDITHWENKLPNALIIEAMTRALLADKKYQYAAGIMRRWHEAELKTIEDVNQYDQNFKNKQTKNSTKFNKNNHHVEIKPDWFKSNTELSASRDVGKPTMSVDELRKKIAERGRGIG